ncbi:MAG: RnfABCDGE type electron transport complex subunit G [Eubacteriaceae bacterium]|nr:RnfABCDGE type electron transport complex subunit G [Eubacteriaceae bacterium]MDD4507803.1 RnfABCDGE type electron transport complex subunit G [Eubacteriaceae bacterium]
MTEKQTSKIDGKKVGKLAIILFLISAIAALLLGLTNYVTKDIIAAQSEKKNIEARQEVLADADSFKKVDNIEQVAQTADSANASIVVEAYSGYKGDQLVGYTVKTTPKGYGGDVEVLTGIGVDGKVSGVTILDQSETAGLGARCVEPSFQQEYQGKDASKELSVVKTNPTDNQIQAITGATITSKAVTKGVNASMKIYSQLASGGVK